MPLSADAFPLIFYSESGTLEPNLSMSKESRPTLLADVLTTLTWHVPAQFPYTLAGNVITTDLYKSPHSKDDYIPHYVCALREIFNS